MYLLSFHSRSLVDKKNIQSLHFELRSYGALLLDFIQDQSMKN